jgi:hypothetical protein
MPADEESKREVLTSIADALQLVFTLASQTINQRPAFPAIDVPTSGSAVLASQAVVTPLPVTVSSNRRDLTHYVDLLDPDTFTAFDHDRLVTFVGNTGTVNVNIPVQTGVGPTTYLLQCRCPDSLAGNCHRVLFDVQAPALPAPPTLTLSAMANGAPLPGGTYPRTQLGIHAVVFTATTAGGTGPFTYYWTVSRSGVTALPVPLATNTYTVDLAPAGTVFPASVVVSCYARDALLQNSPPDLLSYTIT